MKRIISLLLSVILMCSVVVINVSGAEISSQATSAQNKEYRYMSLKDGTIKIVEYMGNKAEVIIPDKIGDKKVTTIGKNAFYQYYKMQKLTLPKYLTKIEKYAFQSCIKLETVNFPSKKLTIGEGAFSGSVNVAEVHISDVRKWCETDFGNSYANPLYYGGGLFVNGEPVGDLVVPDGTKKISGLSFEKVNNLTSITIPDSVTKIGWNAFDHCKSLVSVNIGDGVKLIGKEAFIGCKNIEEITFGKNLKEIKHTAFKGCEKITDFKLPESLKIIENSVFRNCIGIKTFILPQGVETIGDYVFFNCKNLESIEIPESLEYIGFHAFHNTKWYKSQPDGLLYIRDMLYEYKGDCPEEVTIAEGTRLVCDWAFIRCKTLKRITFPDSLKIIGDSAFEGCYNLENFTLPDSLTTIEQSAFSCCDKLTDVELGKNITCIEQAVFEDCRNLKNVKINCSLKTIPRRMFNYCRKLENINIPDSVTEYEWRAFYDCDKLKAPPEGKNVIVYGEAAFEWCDGIEKLEINDNIKILERRAFANCKKLEKVTIPKSVIEMQDELFMNCDALKTVEYYAKNCEFNYYGWRSEPVRKAKNRVFYSCEKIEKFVIGDTVEKLPVDLFRDIIGHSLKEIKICNDMKKIPQKNIDNSKTAKANKDTYSNVLKVNSKGDIKILGYGKANVKFKTSQGEKTVKFNVIPRRVKTKHIKVTKSGTTAVVKIEDTRKLVFTGRVSTDENFENSTKLACKKNTFKIRNMKKDTVYYFEVKAYKKRYSRKITSNPKVIEIS